MPDEFQIIERYFNRTSRRTDVILGVGDDGALVHPPPNQRLVITMDTLNEGIHFPIQTPAQAVGHKALAVNLSDLAAMGATPAWFTLSLSMPGSDELWLEDFTRGLFELANRFEAELIGGDLTRGPLSVTITAIGFTSGCAALRRAGARPGDFIYVTGHLGDAALGLMALRNNITLDPEDLDNCLARLNYPIPRVEAAQCLLDVATAAIDISDGLAGDLNHVLQASGVGAVIELTSLPLSATFKKAFGDKPDWRLPLTGGDDYELLFTVPSDKLQPLNSGFMGMECGITQIGQIQSQPGLRIRQPDGRPYVPDQTGYIHFN